MIHLNLLQSVAFLIAFIAQFSRLFVASRPFWGRLPAWVQTVLPPMIPTLAALSQGLTGVKSWTDLGVVFLGCGALLLPGLPSNRSAAKLQAGKPPTVTPSASDAAVASAMVASGTIPPGPMGGQ